jgi:hypothetical protein
MCVRLVVKDQLGGREESFQQTCLHASRNDRGRNCRGVDDMLHEKGDQRGSIRAINDQALEGSWILATPAQPSGGSRTQGNGLRRGQERADMSDSGGWDEPVSCLLSRQVATNQTGGGRACSVFHGKL